MMKIYQNRFVLLLLAIFFVLPFLTYAATDSFTIRQGITISDSTPPGTPSISSVIPVTSSQIDITWGAVTDNYILGGYQVFRDAIQIATTTLVSFSDTGLSESTTYSYTVRAFDSSGNLSTTSAAVSTTTLSNSTPVATSTPVASTGVHGGVGRLMNQAVGLVSIDILAKEHSVMIDWKTDEYSRYSLRWGRTENYELGYVQSELFSREHSTMISELDAGTVYEYELIAYNRIGKEHVLVRDQFKTKENPDTAAPSNVSGLTAKVDGDTVRLVWNNPTELDLSHVSVVRSHFFYPTHPSSGFLVYSGDRSEVTDASAFEFGRVQYYSVFSYDTNGNRSSGAVLMVVQPSDGGDGSDGSPAQTGNGQVGTPVRESGDRIQKPLVDERDISTSTLSDTGLSTLTFEDLQFLQDGEQLLVGTEGIEVDGAKPLTVRLPYEALPEHLKSILVTFTHPGNDELAFSFLLRVNKDKTAYESVIAPFHQSGLFEVVVSVFDYTNQKTTEVLGSVIVVYDQEYRLFDRPELVLAFTVSLLAVIVAFFFFIFARRRGRD